MHGLAEFLESGLLEIASYCNSSILDGEDAGNDSSKRLLMTLVRKMRTVLKRVAFGPEGFPQFCSLGLRDPQSRIQVLLRTRDVHVDVTPRNVIACAKPLTIGIALQDQGSSIFLTSEHCSLEFHERGAGGRLLGKVGLMRSDTVPLQDGRVFLYHPIDPRNYCLPHSLLWRRYLEFAYQQWRSLKGPKAPEIRMSASDLHALLVFYICPRPVFLVSVVDGEKGNLFPMDLVGSVGEQHLSLALHNTSTGLPLIERSRRVVLSSVPADHMRLAYKLGESHKREQIDWSSVPFALGTSSSFDLPIPEFALRVRELEVGEIRVLGSHTFLICRVVADETRSDGLQFFQAHAFYLPWRQQALPLPVVAA
jgi:flavin reductase (DIM6/NTAB) family NADH-FMN oxidoreductase RutF